MGIEFSYAAETAFVSPTLLKIGVDHQHMTLVWALSPIIGFFATPILGSVSDRCRFRQGRRRPFILLLAIGVLIGLILVPNGEQMGYAFGDTRTNFSTSFNHHLIEEIRNETTLRLQKPSSHPWAIFFTILGTVLLDFNADACQSPARAYLLDITLPEDHTRGLSTFTTMAGLGGFMGYGLGGINWDTTAIGTTLGGHLHATFTLITIIFIICVLSTLTSFKELPLDVLQKNDRKEQLQEKEDDKYDEYVKEKLNKDLSTFYSKLENSVEISPGKGHEMPMDLIIADHSNKYPMAQISADQMNHQTANVTNCNGPDQIPNASFCEYLYSILFMPKSLRIICLTNLCCWMAHVCYSLYFTDFVGEAVYGGDPMAPEGSRERNLYESGVRFGCWGMSMYSLSCSCYSMVIANLIERYKARKVYICNLLFYSIGMMMMALTKHPFGVIIFSWTAGIMYSTLFTMPYLLIAHYHASNTFSVTEESPTQDESIRGLGTDVAIVSSMVFLAQFILSCCLGTMVNLSGTTTTIIWVASALAACGALTATQIMYLDL